MPVLYDWTYGKLWVFVSLTSEDGEGIVWCHGPNHAY